MLKPIVSARERPVPLYLFCTWTSAFLPISPLTSFRSLRTLRNSAILMDQLPPPPPTLLRKSADFGLISRRLLYFSKRSRLRVIQQSNRRIERRWAHVHVTLCRGKVLMPGQLLNRPRRRLCLPETPYML